MNPKARATLCIMAGITVGPALLANVSFASPLSTRGAQQNPANGTHRAAMAQVAAPKYGWSYVNLSKTFGSGTLISGLSTNKQGVTITVTKPAFDNANDSYQSAEYNIATARLGKAHQTTAAKGYNGPISLKWVNPYSSKTLQQATIVSGNKVMAAWPKSVPAYGDFSQTEAYGAVDNQIIGQSGDWLWIALKGPANRPVSLPVYYLFRNWDRLLAVNLKTDAYRLFTIPPLTAQNAVTDVSNTPPAFATDGKQVYVGLSDWVGAFPADPSSIAAPATSGSPASGLPKSGASASGSSAAEGTTSATSTNVWSIALPTPILRPVPMATLESRFTLAETEFSAAVRQEAGSIAYLWDHYVMKKNVPGVSGTTTSWMSDGAYINHGYVPSGMLYGAQFPTVKGTEQAKIQTELITELQIIGKNPLPSSIYTLDTPQKERKYFHGRPPASLPGYQIRGNLYVPDGATWPLPSAYRTYANVFTSIGPLLAQRSPYPVFLPVPSSIVSLSQDYADVNYSVGNAGYSISVYAGNKLPANSPSILAGEANTDFTLDAQAANRPLSIDYRWNMNVAIKGAKVTKENLGHGIVGTLYTKAKTSTQPAVQSIAWKEDGWTWGIESSYVSGGLLGQARQEVGSLLGEPMPTPSGEGVFSTGSDAPSQVDFTWQNARYALYSTGWRAPQIAATMVNLSSY